MKYFQKRLLLGLILNFYAFFSFAQNLSNFCGTNDAEHFKRYKKNIEIIRSEIVQKRTATTYIPVKYILGARTDGSGQVSEMDVLDMHCHLNEIFAEHDIQFYLKDSKFGYIMNDQFYNDHSSIEATIMNLNADLNAINVFIPKNATPIGVPAGTILGYYNSRRDWLVLSTSEVNNESNTLPHELGHYFSLVHPHAVWSFGSFDQNHPDWPIAPSTTSFGILVEKMDSSNCRIAADMLCDTPPDYNQGSINGCEYVGGAKDPCGVLIDPDETLIMSFFPYECTSRFTGEQKEIIIADLASTNRRHLIDSNFFSVPEIMSSDIQIYTPNSPVLFNQDSSVLIDWADIPAATHFVFEYSSNRSFVGAKLAVVDISAIELPKIEPNKKYYYRIKPFNLTGTCTAVSKIFSFETTNTSVSSLNEIDFIEDFKIFPNPIQFGKKIHTSLFSKKNSNAEICIFDLMGKQIFSRKIQLKKGQNQFQIKPNLKSNGILFLRIKTNAGILKKKFVVIQ